MVEMKAPNREEPISTDEARKMLEKQANADWWRHGFKMFVLGVLVCLVILFVGINIILKNGGF